MKCDREFTCNCEIVCILEDIWNCILNAMRALWDLFTADVV